MASQGLTGEVVAKEVLDKVAEFQDTTQSARQILTRLGNRPSPPTKSKAGRREPERSLANGRWSPLVPVLGA